MEEHKKFWDDCFRIGTRQCGVLMGMLGAGLAFLLLFLRFWKTLMVAAFFMVGYAVGANSNKAVLFKAWINKIFPPKGE